MKKITIDGKSIKISDESYKAFKDQFIKPEGRWEPEEDEMYWTISDEGAPIYTIWRDDGVDNFRLNQGNVFKTEEAEKHLEYLKAEAVLKESADWWQPDWSDGEEKYYIKYHNDLRTTHIFDTINFQSNSIYFETEEKAKASIKNHEKEWKIYFGIE